jgi:hypothetical protein
MLDVESQIVADWMAVSVIIWDSVPLGSTRFGMPVVTAPNSPYSDGTTPLYRGKIIDPYGHPVGAAQLSSLTLTIVDTLTGVVINNCDRVDILNTGRGAIDAVGNLLIRLEVADTLMTEVPGATKVQRSMIIEWQFQPTPPGQQYEPLGFQQITNLTVPVGFTVPEGAVVAIVTPEDAGVRYIDDGTIPTSTHGMPIGPGVSSTFAGSLDTPLFVEQTEGAKLNVTYYGIVPPEATGRHQVNFILWALAQPAA